MSSPFRFLLGFLTLLTALALQFWLVPFSIRADLAFAVLVTFAFLFEIWEMVVFDLFAILVLNWQPALSPDIVAFALIPLAVFLILRRIRVSAWLGSMVAITLSLIVLYLVVAPIAIVSSFTTFFLDVILCLVTGQIVLFGIENAR